jgi:hypothetical protein
MGDVISFARPHLKMVGVGKLQTILGLEVYNLEGVQSHVQR